VRNIEPTSRFSIADLDDFTVGLAMIALKNPSAGPASEPCKRLADIFAHEFFRWRGETVPVENRPTSAEPENIEDIDFRSCAAEEIWPIIVAISSIRESCRFNHRLDSKKKTDAALFFEGILNHMRAS